MQQPNKTPKKVELLIPGQVDVRVSIKDANRMKISQVLPKELSKETR